jgi:hypothetical protein
VPCELKNKKIRSQVAQAQSGKTLRKKQKKTCALCLACFSNPIFKRLEKKYFKEASRRLGNQQWAMGTG